jgi:hypothetical protein
MSHSSRSLGFLGLTILALATALVPQAADAVTPPKGGLVEITGYKRLGLDGNAGPVVVAVTRRRAAALRTALASLPPKASPSDCMESIAPFTIRFLPRNGAQPTMVASAFDCAGYGVGIAVGKSITELEDDCALQSLVLSALPRSQLRGTTRAVAVACPGGEK